MLLLSFFLRALLYIGKSAKLFAKRTLSCNTPPKLKAILFAQHTLAVMSVFHTAYSKFVVNALVSDTSFLTNNC